MTELLLKCGAHTGINEAFLEAQTTQMARLLITFGADIHRVGYRKQTLLHKVISNNYSLKEPELIKYLIDQGLSPFDKDEDGWTALHCAFLNIQNPVRIKKIDCLMQALEPSQKIALLKMKTSDGQGKTILDLLQNEKHTTAIVSHIKAIHAQAAVDFFYQLNELHSKSEPESYMQQLPVELILEVSQYLAEEKIGLATKS